MDNAKGPETFIGNGPVYMARIESGQLGKLFWVGDASALSYAHEISDKKEHYEKHTGNQVLYDSVGGKKKTTMSLTMHERKKETLQLVLQAQVEEVATVTGATKDSRDDLVAGDVWSLGVLGLTKLVLKDSKTSSATTLEEGTHYTVTKFGLITLLDVDGLTLPIKATFDHGAKTVFKPMSDDVDGYYLEYHCKNIAGQKELSIIKTYRFNPDPASAFDLINEDFSELALEGECLYDAEIGAPYTVEYAGATAATTSTSTTTTTTP